METACDCILRKRNAKTSNKPEKFIQQYLFQLAAWVNDGCHARHDRMLKVWFSCK